MSHANSIDSNIVNIGSQYDVKFFGFIEISYNWIREVATFDREHDLPPLFGPPIY